MSKMIMDKQLSACETIIMKAIWDFGGDIPLQELMRALRDDYQKDYARTTVATFLSRLASKGYIETYRKGRISFTHPLKSEKEYKEHMIGQERDFWFDGSVPMLLSALISTREFSEQDKQEIRDLLNS